MRAVDRGSRAERTPRVRQGEVGFVDEATLARGIPRAPHRAVWVWVGQAHASLSSELHGSDPQNMWRPTHTGHGISPWASPMRGQIRDTPLNFFFVKSLIHG